MTQRILTASLTVGLLLLMISTVAAQTTQFTYQGKLTDSGNPANGQYDFQFKLFDVLSGGAQQGTTQTLSNVTVTSGIFTVQLDFGACPTCFNGAARFLEIAVKPTSGGSFITLTPRQQITSTPYAIETINATQLGGIPASGFIQNTTTPQTANLNITGNGTVGGNLTVGGTLSLNIVNATTQFNLGGQRILSNPGVNNLFAGVSAGAANTSGCCSTFFGFHAGAMSNANDNSFFGNNAGAATSSGNRNSFFGSAAGFSNVSGVGNSFFGVSAGQQSIGSNNSFFGDSAGFSNTGSGNSFYGASAGFRNTTGTVNSFFGINAGSNTDTGSFNAFFGNAAGQTNTTGTNNTIIGSFSNVGSNNLTNAAAIGANALVEQSNSLVLGSISGVNNATASVNVGIGTTTPLARLHVSGGTALFDGNVKIGTQLGGGKLVVEDTSIGTAIYGTTSTNGSGVVGQSSGASGFGVYGDAPGGGYAIYANGNAGQARDKGGFAKAMIYLDRNGTIVRCYNGITGSSTGNCGFTSSHHGLGQYDIDFGFQIIDRFIVATSLYDSGSTAATIKFFPTVSTGEILIHYIDDHANSNVGALTDAPFYVIVF